MAQQADIVNGKYPKGNTMPITTNFSSQIPTLILSYKHVGGRITSRFGAISGDLAMR